MATKQELLARLYANAKSVRTNVKIGGLSTAIEGVFDLTRDGIAAKFEETGGEVKLRVGKAHVAPEIDRTSGLLVVSANQAAQWTRAVGVETDD